MAQRQNSSKRLLWILPKWPLPMQDGSRVANISLLRGLTGLGVGIDIIAVAGDDEVCDVQELQNRTQVDDCFVVRRKVTGSHYGLLGMLGALRSVIVRPWLAITLLSFGSARVRREIKTILKSNPSRWDAIVYDGLHPAAHSSLLGKFIKPNLNSKIVYRAHNVEAEIWNRKAQMTGFLPFRWFIQIQACLMKRFEDSVVNQADAVATVSDTDLDFFRKTVPQLKGAMVPIGYDFSSPLRIAELTSEKVLFLGRLDWPPNRDGLTWVLDQVWSEAKKRRPSLELIIVGSGNSNWLSERAPQAGVKFLGKVDDLEKVYQESILSLVPIFYGSGTRVKAIEASRYGRACLSTAIGIEGLGLEAGKTYIHAEKADEWISILANLDRNHVNEVGQAAHQWLKRSFHLTAAAQKFIELLY